MLSLERFFSSITEIHQFSLSLRWNQQHLCCPHCNKHDQWVSHGFVYKQQSIDTLEPVGKRIICSNRFGRSGCGRTHRLYCADRAPCLNYALSCCISFFMALLFDNAPGVSAAYQLATGAADGRNAWRWLNKLSMRIAAIRTFVLSKSYPVNTPQSTSANTRNSPLFNTLEQLLKLFGKRSACTFQLNTQTSFI